jgi:hypothetical protein
MQETVTAAMIHEQFAEVAQRPVTLITIYGGGLDAPILATDCPDFIPGTARRGFISSGSYGATLLGGGAQEHIWFPFSAQQVGTGIGDASRQVKLTIGNSDGEIAQAIRAADPMPYITIESVRRETPNTVEQSVRGAKVRGVDISGENVQGTLERKTLAKTPAVRGRYTLQRNPALG